MSTRYRSQRVVVARWFKTPTGQTSRRGSWASRSLHEPRTVPLLVAAYLALVYLAILFVDVLQLGGQAWLATRTDQALLWHHLLRSQSPTDVLHWALLGFLVVACGLFSGRLYVQGQQRASRFWLLIAITAAILMVDTTASFILLTYHTRNILSVGSTDFAYTASQVIHYLVLAIVPAYAFTRYWDVVRKTPAMRWLIAGLGVYVALILLNITRSADDWYQSAGRAIVERYPGLMYAPPGTTPPASNQLVAFMINESAQLVAAALLVAALVAYKKYNAATNEPKEPQNPEETNAEPEEPEEPTEHGLGPAKHQEPDKNDG